MRSFDVLAKGLSFDRDYILEASAGTGKTFSIENIVLRLLVEGETPPTIDQILVVTFTRAATRELQNRLYSRLEEVLRQIEREEPLPSFLEEYCDQQLWNTKRRLQRALACFHEAAILTIHGFCLKMLCEHGEAEMDEAMTPLRREQVIRDFLRSEVVEERYSPAQIRTLLARHGYDDDALCHTLTQYSYSGAEPALPFCEQQQLFWKMLLELREKWNAPSPEQVRSDYEKLARCRKGCCQRSGELREELALKITRFSQLFSLSTLKTSDFDRLLQDGTEIFEALEKDLKARAKPPSDAELNCPGLFSEGLRPLRALLQEASGYGEILARLVADCHRRIHAVQEEEELLDSDQLLHRMERASQQETFSQAIASRFQYALVDEFQDTDPVQWNIFRSLFLEGKQKTHLYLVGDPKQSIYAFRNADIYTYLEAVKRLGSEALHSLDTNYRSQPRLVEGLNRLFAASPSHFIPLPRLEEGLVYRPVHAAAGDFVFRDGLPPLCLMVATAKQGRSRSWPSQEVEMTLFFPTIVNEIQRLRREDGIACGEQAILVRDRYQGERAARYLKQWGIPCQQRRTRPLIESSAVSAVRLALTATLSRGEEAVAALGTALFGWSAERLYALQKQIDEEPIAALELLEPFSVLRQVLEQYGVGAWYRLLLENSGAVERLVGQDGGESYLDEATQVVEALVRYQAETGARGERLLLAFKEMAEWARNDDERGFLRSDVEQDAVTIMTLHASKGLEFSVVYALGVINRTLQNRPLARIAGGALVPTSDPRHTSHLQEVDAEKLRQLYVCLTRAKQRLYLPVLFAQEGKPPEPGTASPMEILLNQFLEESTEQRLREWIEGQESYFGVIPEATAVQKEDSHREEITLEEPPKVIVEEHARSILSFTALIRGKSSSGGFSASKIGMESEDVNKHTLPAGAAVGTMLHNLMEKAPWQRNIAEWFEGAEVRALLGEWFLWREPIAEMIEQTLQLDLGGWRLSELSQEAVVQEMEFLYPIENDFLKGYIDAVVFAAGRYWIFDWKSNRLGEESCAYSREAVEKAMDDHHYRLQAALYTEALRRHLALTDSRPFEEIFGGVYYIFLRGLDADGVCFLEREALEKISFSK